MSKAAPTLGNITIAIGSAAATVAIAVGAIHASNASSNPLFRSEPSEQTTTAQEINARSKINTSIDAQIQNSSEGSKEQTSEDSLESVSSLPTQNVADVLPSRITSPVSALGSISSLVSESAISSPISTKPNTSPSAPTYSVGDKEPTGPVVPATPEYPETPSNPETPADPEEAKITINYEFDGTYSVYETVGSALWADPVRDGYTFAGWYKDAGLSDGPYDSILSSWKDGTTLYPKWIKNSEPEPEVWYITYIDDTGYDYRQAPSTYTKESASSIELPFPEREGYVFLGWLDVTTNNIVYDLNGCEGNVILEAIWMMDI